MKYKWIMALCCAMLLCALAGCQLARETAGANAHEDKLIGVFITTEYLDLFDFEGYLNDNISGFRGGEISVDGDTQKYQGRLYATLISRPLTNEETGEITQMEEYVFENVEGIPCFVVTMPMPELGENDSYIASSSNEAVSDEHIAASYGDESRGITLTGTIYTAPSNKKHTYYFNPVYQSADGSVYVTTSGSGFMVNDESYSEGSVYSQTLEAVTTVTENGETKTDSMSVTVSISVMFAPEKIVILQMDADSSILSRTEYAPGSVPESLVPEADTAYLIVETHKRDDTNSLKIAREVYGRDAESFETFSVREDGICVKRWTQIEWAG